MSEKHRSVTLDRFNFKADLHRLSGSKDVVGIAASGEPILRDSEIHIYFVRYHQERERGLMIKQYKEYMSARVAWNNLKEQRDRLRKRQARCSEGDRRELQRLKQQLAVLKEKIVGLEMALRSAETELKEAKETIKNAEKIAKLK